MHSKSKAARRNLRCFLDMYEVKILRKKQLFMLKSKNSCAPFVKMVDCIW